MSGTVRDQVGNRLDLPFEDLGEQTLKNIARPIRVYSISFGEPLGPVPPAGAAAAAAGQPQQLVADGAVGSLYGYLGKPEKGMSYFEEARLLDPFFDPPWYWPSVGIVHFTAGRYDDASQPSPARRACHFGDIHIWRRRTRSPGGRIAPRIARPRSSASCRTFR